MTSSITTHWRACSGSIHPLDHEALNEVKDEFNLDYPPPAYIGDIDNASVILLNGNGGYDPVMTPGEFPDQASVDRAIERLHHPAPVDPLEVSPYYAGRNYAGLIRDGKLALVNAVPYRSRKITTAIRRVAKVLPSSLAHIRWLRDEALPAAASGERLVIAHRFALWDLKLRQVQPGLHFTSAPVSPDLPRATLAEIDRLLTAS